MSYSILFSIKVGGTNNKVFNIDRLIKSILQNMYEKNFEIHFLQDESASPDVKIFLDKVVLENSQIKLFRFKSLSWYEYLQNSFLNSKNFTYLYQCHDDLFFKTMNFDKQAHEIVKNINNIGAFSFFNDESERGNFFTQCRPGFFIDRIYKNSRRRGLEFEFCNQFPYWHYFTHRTRSMLLKFNINPYNNKIIKKFTEISLIKSRLFYPNSICRAHSLNNDLMIFKSENLKYLKSILDFQIPSGLASDDDVCLECTKNDLVNAFIPTIHYLHDRPYYGGTRSIKIINKNSINSKKKFVDKWKFIWIEDSIHTKEEKISAFKKSEKLYGKNFSWSGYLNSYDWLYLK